MQAFLNDSKIKQKYLDRLRAHAAADEIIKGKYWEDGKGCAIGCTIHSSEHKKYEDEIGPEWFARVEDVIFEGLPNARAKLWPIQLLDAIIPGQDLDKIKTPFIIFILEESIKSMKSSVFDAEKFPDSKKAIDQSEAAILQMIECHKNNFDLSAAWSTARSAASAAWSAARSAASAASAAWSAARSAARSAASAAYEKFADKLLELIKERI